jgi:PIN domain nuclease of toxin-antitoxin system
MILLDTHVMVYLVTEPSRLSRAAARTIRKARSGDGIAVAAITMMELATLLVRGRLRVSGTVEATIERMLDMAGVTVRPITAQIAALAAQFPDSYPGDPADRLIGATALAEGMTLITRDERILASALIRSTW